LRQVKAAVASTGNLWASKLAEALMPYPTNAALPMSVRNHLPALAQDIYREAFNEVWGDSCRCETSIPQGQ
jgi:hypothetical protein